MSTRDDVLELLKRSEPMTPAQVATRLALPYERTRKCMQRLARAGELVSEDGRYSSVPDPVNSRDITTEHRDTTPGEGHRILVLRDQWEDPPPPPRLRDRWDWL